MAAVVRGGRGARRRARRFGAGGELTRDATRELPWGAGSMTGYSIVHAASLDVTEPLARDNPFVAAIRVHELGEG